MGMRAPFPAGGPDRIHHQAGDGKYRQLKRDVAGVKQDTRHDLNQLQLQASKRPVHHRLGPLNAAQQGSQVVGIRLLVAGARYLDPVKRDITLNYEISCFRSASERA